jgi:hypothetical protein
MTFTLPPRPFPEEARGVTQIIEDVRGALWDKHNNRAPIRLTEKQRKSIARSRRSARDIAAYYGISESYVYVLRAKYRKHPKEILHGTAGGYNKGGCRCEECRDWPRRRYQRIKQQKAAAA